MCNVIHLGVTFDLGSTRLFLLQYLRHIFLITKIYGLLQLIVSTGSIRWILWFSVRYAAARREIFGVNALRGKRQQLGSPNLQDIFIGG